MDIRKSILSLIEESRSELQHNVPEPTSENEKLALVFWRKVLENSQAIIALIDVGFLEEAETINRLALENFFFMLALINSSDTLKKMEAAAGEPIAKMARTAMNKEASFLTPENKKELEEYLQKLLSNAQAGVNSSSKFTAFEASGIAEMEPFYNSRYRLISLRSAHASLLSALNKAEGLRDDVLISLGEILQISLLSVREHTSSAKR
jgi:ferritin-like metal-binding protein YciE